jgi:hypothetical protein
VSKATRQIARLAVAGLGAVCAAFPLSAQQLGVRAQLDIAGNYLFGNVEQRLLTAHVQFARADSSVELRSDVRYSYSDIATATQPQTVNRRNWLASLSIDQRPFALFSPFFFVSIEASEEQRIERRINAGLGAKYTVQRDARGESSISAAWLAEDTRATEGSPPTPQARLVRWSVRVRLRRNLDERLSVTHETNYRPIFGTEGQFTFVANTVLGYRVAGATRITLSYLHAYDSEAIARGATQNSDGQVQFGVSTTF